MHTYSPTDYTSGDVKTRFWLKTHKANKAGTAPISLRLTLAGQSAEVSTTIRVLPAEWGGHDLKVTGGDPSTADAYNKTLSLLAAKATLKASQLELDPTRTEPVTAAEVARSLRPRRAVRVAAPEPEPLLHTRLEAALCTAYTAGNASTYASLASSLKAWGRWPGAAGLLLADLTASVAKQYSVYLKEKYAPTSRSTMLSGLNTLLRHAAPGHPVNFSGLSKGAKAQRKNRKTAGRDIIARLESLADLPPGQQLVRDTFLIQYYLHGSRVGAVLELRKDQVDLPAGRVRFTAHKSVRHKDVKIHAKLRPLLERHLSFCPGPLLLPYLPVNYFQLNHTARFKKLDNARGTVTAALHRLSARAGLPVRLHSHVARHTAALRAYEKTGDLRVPQQMLGHANIAETAGYIASLSTTELDSAVESVYDE